MGPKGQSEASACCTNSMPGDCVQQLSAHPTEISQGRFNPRQEEQILSYSLTRYPVESCKSKFYPVHLFREKERRYEEENVASPSRDGQRIWIYPLEAGQTVAIGVEMAFDQGRPLASYPAGSTLLRICRGSSGSVARQGGGVGMPEDSCQIA